MSIKYVCWLCIEMFDCVFWESHEQIEGEGIIVDLSSSKIREKPIKQSSTLDTTLVHLVCVPNNSIITTVPIRMISNCQIGKST